MIKGGKVKTADDEEIITVVTWSDPDFGDPVPENFKDNVVVLGKINPPITDVEFVYLGLGPKQPIYGKLVVTNAGTFPRRTLIFENKDIKL